MYVCMFEMDVTCKTLCKVYTTTTLLSQQHLLNCKLVVYQGGHTLCKLQWTSNEAQYDAICSLPN